MNRLTSRFPPLTIQCRGGNCVLEMLLFTPLALFFLFAVIDGGLTFREKSAVVDAIRSGILSQALHRGFNTITSAEFVESLDIPAEQVDQMLSGVTAEVAENILRSRGQPENAEIKDFRVSAALVALNVDNATGELVSHRTLNPIITYPAHSVFNISDLVPDFPHRSIQAFVADSLALEYSRTPSSYAVPLTIAREHNGLRHSFLQRTLLLCVEVTALPKSFAPVISRNLLGRYYAVEEHQLMPLRMQLN